MTPDAHPPSDRPARAPTSVRTAASYTLAALLVSALSTVLGAPLWVGALLVVAAGLVGFGVYRREAWPVWIGLGSLGFGSLSVGFPGPISASALVFLLVGGPLFALLASALGETGKPPAVRAQPATRSHQLRILGLGVLGLVLISVPLLFASTRLAFASDMGTTLAILLVSGSAVLAFGLPLTTLRRERQPADADELPLRGVTFNGPESSDGADGS